jgi:hypothetical protein
VAVVTGGGAGIGRGIVLCMAREGADIAIPDIQDADAQAVVKEVLALGRKAISMRCDVTRGAEVQARFRLPVAYTEVLVDQESLNYLAPLARLGAGAVHPLDPSSGGDVGRMGAGDPTPLDNKNGLWEHIQFGCRAVQALARCLS